VCNAPSKTKMGSSYLGHGGVRVMQRKRRRVKQRRWVSGCCKTDAADVLTLQMRVGGIRLCAQGMTNLGVSQVAMKQTRLNKLLAIK